MRKHITPLLIKNSISSIYCAIEIHNKPRISFRYETVTILVINTWELLLKGYLHKYHKSYKLIEDDGRYKTLTKILDFLKTKISDEEFLAIYINLKKLIEYRNLIQHFYIKDLDLPLFSLISSSILHYQNFLSKFLNKSILSKDEELVLLPVGFKKPFRPFDFLTNDSFIREAPAHVKEFIEGFFISQKELDDKNITDEFAVNFKYHLQSVSKSSSDEVINIDNTIKNKNIFTIQKNSNISFTNDPSAPRFQLSEDEIFKLYPLVHKDIMDFLKIKGIKVSKQVNDKIRFLKQNPSLVYRRQLYPNNPKSPIAWRYSNEFLNVLEGELN